MPPRIGFGFDVHQLAEGHSLIIGGVNIPHQKGTVGHSDGDVLLHSLCDALLGAANLGDIGQHFPDSDPQYKNIDSQKLLSHVQELLRKEQYKIINIDSVVCLQRPSLAEYIKEMQNTIADRLSISQDKVSIKATTTEKLGVVGREEGVAAYATVLIENAQS